MKFGVLGPVTAERDGERLPLAAPMVRSLLGVLLRDAGSSVPEVRLIEALWRDRQPVSARSSLHNHVLRLRRILGPQDSERVRRTLDGYVIDVGPGELDLHEFEVLRRRGIGSAAEGRWADAEEDLSRAVALWRGEPLADVIPAARDILELDHLQEARIQAVEQLAAAQLRLGRYDEVMAALTPLVKQHPWREAGHGYLMHALYGAGRQAEALTVYQNIRTNLIDELGIEPTAGLVELHRRILVGDTSLIQAVEQPDRKTVTETAATIEAPERNHAQVRPARGLPPDVVDFTGRGPEIDRLLASATEPATGTLVISAIDGMAGVGKTTLAVHVAHALADRFADGQLFLDLHGFTPGRAPLDLGTALARLLRAVGIGDDGLPSDPEERVLLWRNVVAERRVLVVLDNAYDSAQVRPLIPGSPGSLVLVTSRHRMLALDGAVSLSLDVLDRTEAIALFIAVCGPERIAGQEDVVAEIAAMCGDLPLAVRIAAARLAHHGTWAPVHLLARLRGRASLLTELSVQDRSVGAAFAVSYEALPPDQRRLFRMAGLHPGNDFSTHALAAISGSPAVEIEDILDELHARHLVVELSPGRYSFHDLLRHHARELAEAQVSETDRRDALTRLFQYHDYCAAAAMNILYPHETHRRPQPPRPAGDVEPFADASDARTWLEREMGNLLAAGTHPLAGPTRHTGDLSSILFRYLDHHGHYAEALTLHTAAAEVAAAAGDTARHASAQANLGGAYWCLGRYLEAVDCMQAALDGFRSAGDDAGERKVLTNLGVTHAHLGRFPEAVDYLTRALASYRAAGDQTGQVVVLNNLGATAERTGDFQQAANYHREGLDLARRVGDAATEGRILANLGQTLHRLGQSAEASQLLHESLALAVRSGERGRQISTLLGIGDIERATDPASALVRDEQSRDMSIAIGDRFWLANSLLRIGDDHEAMGDLEAAGDHWRQGLDISLGLDAAAQIEAARERLARHHRAQEQPAPESA